MTDARGMDQNSMTTFEFTKPTAPITTTPGAVLSNDSPFEEVKAAAVNAGIEGVSDRNESENIQAKTTLDDRTRRLESDSGKLIKQTISSNTGNQS